MPGIFSVIGRSFVHSSCLSLGILYLAAIPGNTVHYMACDVLTINRCIVIVRTLMNSSILLKTNTQLLNCTISCMS